MKRHWIRTAVLLVFLAVMTALLLFGPKGDFSVNEKRVLAQAPDLSPSAILKGETQKELEDAKILRLTNSIKSATVKMAELKDKIASCSEAIGAATLDEVAAAVKAAAGEVKAPQDAESDAEREKAEKKAEAMDVSNIIHDALDKMCDDIAKMIADRRLEPV